MAFRPVTHVLFDMDGLILNTEDLYTVAFQNILSPFGKEYSYELKTRLMGLQAQETACAIVQELDLPLNPRQFMEKTKEQFQILFPESEVMPGARRLIEHLHSNNVPLGLATSSSIDSYWLKVSQKHQDLFSKFDYKTFGSSESAVKKGKPYPDIFLVAAAKFPGNPLPEQCLVFEDAVNGVKAARAAHMQVVMVPDARLSAELTKEATLVLTSLECFKPEMFGLPPFEDDKETAY